MSAAGDILGLVFALPLLAFSLLAIFRAPSLPLVFLAVGATELGHWFALVTFVLAILLGILGAPLTTVALLYAAVLFLTPAIRAVRASRSLRAEITAAFGSSPPTFRWRDLLRLSIDHRSPAERVTIAGPGGPLAFDFSSAGTTAPLVVIVHGGGWMAGDSRELAGWNAWLNARGFAVASVEYRLVPNGTWPAQRDDVLAAIDHLREKAALYGIDPDRILLLGRSAGGQIASAIAANDAPAWLRGCVCLYSPFDMNFAYEHGGEEDVLRSRWLLRCYLGGTPPQEPAHYHEASAYHTVTAGAPPFLLVHGQRDELVWIVQSQRFAARLADLAVPHALIELPWATHAFDFNLHGPGGQAFAAALSTFLDHTCGPSTKLAPSAGTC
jgi:acetyl esterase/lipase